MTTEKPRTGYIVSEGGKTDFATFWMENRSRLCRVRPYDAAMAAWYAAWDAATAAEHKRCQEKVAALADRLWEE